MAHSPRAGERQGRFELRRELGRGAQATVWLAHDPLLQREVALKLLEGVPADESGHEHWLHEARAVSALSHPHIVPVFEAVDAEQGGGRPYLVFEYVPGPTLAQARRARGPWPAREAATLMLGVLDAVAAAHELGLVHRDLKPSNVLLGNDGRARVMDFGIAALVPQSPSRRGGHKSTSVPPGGEGAIVGSPGYMSPEAARGEPPAPAMDVFAAGVMLGELLAGAPLMIERDPWRALERVQREDLALPDGVPVDDALRGIVRRALARDPQQRYDNARAMHGALAAWLDPDAAPVAAEAGHATLAFLLRRMRHKTDFPALSDSVLRIQRLTASDTANLASLADEILGDVALTHKLLRMVNSVHFASAAGSGQITTVSRAVALVGFAGIRNMAMAVLLLEHMGDKGHARVLREEFLRALTAGALASELEPRARESEEAFLGSMLQNLGRLLAEYYFPEEAQRIRQLAVPRQDAAGAADAHAAAAASPAAEADTRRESAAIKVLGLSLDELGQGVARAWGLPEGLQQAMRRPTGTVPTRGLVDRGERLRWLGVVANEMADALMTAGGDASPEAMERIATRYSTALGLAPQAASEAAVAARERVATLARALGLPAPQRSAAAHAVRPRAEACAAGKAGRAGRAGAAAAGVAAGASGDVGHGDAPTVVMAAKPVTVAGCEAALNEGRTRIERGLADGSLRLNEVLHIGLSTLQQSLDCRGVVFCLRDAASGALTGRVALGPLPARAFLITPGRAGDLLSVVCARMADTLIADATGVLARMPPWWRQQVHAGTFVLLPLALKGATIGLIYADKAEAGSLAPSEGELAAVRSLRDAVVGAFARGLR